MHCPGCGTQTSADQKFCRSCGVDLQTISLMMTNSSFAPISDREAIESDKAIAHRMIYILSLGGIVLLAGVAILVLGKKLLHNEIVELTGGLLLLAGLLASGYALFSAMLASTAPSRRQQRMNRVTKADVEIERTPELLLESVPSVVENTTRLLEDEANLSARENSGEVNP